MIARSSFVLLSAALLLCGCSLFHHDAPVTGGGTPVPAKKSFSLWPLGHSGPEDATGYLEYQRTRSGTDKANYTLVARNTHLTKTIEGDIRTTVETAVNETKVDTEHFTLAPNESKKLLTFPEHTHLTYEVSAFFKE
jgi:hypothetical protein